MLYRLSYMSTNLYQLLERAAGIEPASSAWKAEVLPLNYARLNPQTRQVAPIPVTLNSAFQDFTNYGGERWIIRLSKPHPAGRH